MKIQTECRCVVDETMFSIAMLISRLLVSGAVLYFVIGIMLNFRTLAHNYAALTGFAVPSGVVIVLCLLALCACFALLLGYRTRAAAIGVIVFNIINGFFFNAGHTNMVFLFFILLSLAPLITVILLGPGKYSLDFRKAVIESKQFLSK
ncbi:putative oxidoreductase [Elusimicrobium simillimum]|uniref:DoxX family protein n=1 Tax=Elusimicrobium simillimum TaxID=3143438 RepID=UPI003C705B76